MPVYRMPSGNKRDVSLRIYGVGISLAVAILLFSFFEPEGTSHSTNVALAFVMGGIVLATVVCANVLPYRQAMSQFKRAFEWELTNDKLVQKHKDGRTVEIGLNDIKSFQESRGGCL